MLPSQILRFGRHFASPNRGLAQDFIVRRNYSLFSNPLIIQGALRFTQTKAILSSTNRSFQPQFFYSAEETQPEDALSKFQRKTEKAIEVLARKRHSELVYENLEKLVKKGITPSSSTLARVIRVYADVNQYLRALRLFKEFEADPKVKVDKDMYIAVIGACAKAGDTDGIHHYSEKMISAGIEPCAQVYNCSLYSPDGGAELVNVVQTFREMEKKGIKPNRRSYSILIRACGDNRRWQEAERAYQKMQENGIPPNRLVLNHLIRALCKSGQVARAHELIRKDMPASNVVPDAIPYNDLMKAYMTMGDTHRVEQILAQMEAGQADEVSGVKLPSPDVYSYALAMSAQVSAGEGKAALATFDRMRERRVPPSKACYVLAVDAAVMTENFERAAELKRFMKRRGFEYSDRDVLPRKLPDLEWWKERKEQYESELQRVTLPIH